MKINIRETVESWKNTVDDIVAEKERLMGLLAEQFPERKFHTREWEVNKVSLDKSRNVAIVEFFAELGSGKTTYGAYNDRAVLFTKKEIPINEFKLDSIEYGFKNPRKAYCYAYGCKEIINCYLTEVKKISAEGVEPSTYIAYLGDVELGTFSVKSNELNEYYGGTGTLGLSFMER